MNAERKLTVWIVIGAMSLIWSSTWLAIKVGISTVPPFLSAGWRFLIAFFPLFIYARLKGLTFPRDLRSHLFFLGFSFSIYTAGYALVYWGEQYINSGLASVLFSIMPFYVALFSIRMLPSEKVTLKKMAGITVGFLGVVIIFVDQLHLTHPMAVYGMIAVSLSPGLSAYGTIVGKNARRKYHVVTLNTFPLLYSSIIFFVMHLLFEQASTVTYTPAAVASFFYLGLIGTALAFVLYFWILKTASAVLISLTTFITPPLALLWGWLVLGEPVTIQLMVGMVVIFAGIAVVRRG